MKIKFKKFISFCLSLLMMGFLLVPIDAHAATNNEFTRKQYDKLVKDGVVGNDVSYQDLKTKFEEGKKFEQTLENSGKFHRVKRSASSMPYLEAGDIIITNSTSSGGITGHAAIALGSDEILHIAGPGQRVTVVSPSTFENMYSSGWIKVYRPNNSRIGGEAASWAERTYRGSNAKYKITMNLASTDETYCSKIVWQAYYYGVGKNVVAYIGQNITWGMRHPYDLVDVLSSGDYTMEEVN